GPFTLTAFRAILERMLPAVGDPAVIFCMGITLGYVPGGVQFNIGGGPPAPGIEAGGPPAPGPPGPPGGPADAAITADACNKPAHNVAVTAMLTNRFPCSDNIFIS
ncbi:MAG: hypothetical protein IKM86_04110, partial [Acidaminococcaceae bacterium]|nr:hypothetical protein [Acidaminococcaceae bacterium]